MSATCLASAAAPVLVKARLTSVAVSSNSSTAALVGPVGREQVGVGWPCRRIVLVLRQSGPQADGTSPERPRVCLGDPRSPATPPCTPPGLARTRPDAGGDDTVRRCREAPQQWFRPAPGISVEDGQPPAALPLPIAERQLEQLRRSPNDHRPCLFGRAFVFVLSQKGLQPVVHQYLPIPRQRCGGQQGTGFRSASGAREPSRNTQKNPLLWDLNSLLYPKLQPKNPPARWSREFE